MKKIISLTTIGVMVFGAGNVLACYGGCPSKTSTEFTESGAANFQEQTQNINDISFGNSHISTLNQEQNGFGGSVSMNGSGASEGQNQGQYTDINLGNHNYNSTEVSWGDSFVDGRGIAVHTEHQNLDAGIATLSNGNGTFSGSGAASDINQNVGVRTNGRHTGADAGTYIGFHSDYTLTNNGPTSVITQNGRQDARFETGVSSHGRRGNANGNLNATQAGGTIAANNGNGTSMVGGGVAIGSITATNTANCHGTSYIIGGQEQIHTYHQESDNGAGQSQWANGMVHTYNTVDNSVN